MTVYFKLIATSIITYTGTNINMTDFSSEKSARKETVSNIFKILKKKSYNFQAKTLYQGNKFFKN